MPKEATFKVGEQVQLKSGGPIMTVEGPALGNSNNLRCQWFAGKKLEKGVFPPESLQTPEKKSEQ